MNNLSRKKTITLNFLLVEYTNSLDSKIVDGWLSYKLSPEVEEDPRKISTFVSIEVENTPASSCTSPPRQEILKCKGK